LFKNLNRKWVPFFVHYSYTTAPQQREADGGEVEVAALLFRLLEFPACVVPGACSGSSGCKHQLQQQQHQTHQHELKFRQSSLQH
jgi:hypothetical protein